jgi:cob(I)alamin adenosyltransferase
MKIYTKTGDDGTTSLFGGTRVSKSDPRIDCYGTVDELNSVIGIAVAANPSHELSEPLREIQALLFVLGADLATPADQSIRIDRITEADVARLESWIDTYDARLPALRHFILPGGTPVAAALHLARTVCRRAERLLVDARSSNNHSDATLLFLNRLSDLLFVLARYANHSDGIPDTPWIPR